MVIKMVRIYVFYHHRKKIDELIKLKEHELNELYNNSYNFLKNYI